VTTTEGPTDKAAVAEEPRLRIGEVAKQTGVTARTLRYWEEIGLLEPFAHRGGGERLYSVAELERVTHIRELQDLLGLTLAEIAEVLAAEDALERARRAARRADAEAPKAPRRGHRGERAVARADQRAAGPHHRISRRMRGPG
jgi:DNA-binding transcriptional MerR regulator